VLTPRNSPKNLDSWPCASSGSAKWSETLSSIFDMLLLTTTTPTSLPRFHLPIKTSPSALPLWARLLLQSSWPTSALKLPTAVPSAPPGHLWHIDFNCCSFSSPGPLWYTSAKCRFATRVISRVLSSPRRHGGGDQSHGFLPYFVGFPTCFRFLLLPSAKTDDTIDYSLRVMLQSVIDRIRSGSSRFHP